MSELSYVSFFPFENAVIGAGTVSKVPSPKTPPTNTLSSKLVFSDISGKQNISDMPDISQITTNQSSITSLQSTKQTSLTCPTLVR